MTDTNKEHATHRTAERNKGRITGTMQHIHKDRTYQRSKDTAKARKTEINQERKTYRTSKKRMMTLMQEWRTTERKKERADVGNEDIKKDRANQLNQETQKEDRQTGRKTNIQKTR